MGTTILQFLAILFMALALVPAGAHFFALPNKMALGQEAYFTVQAIYRGWALFGIVFIAALVATLALAIRLRGRGAAFALGVIACACVAASLAIFFIWTYPANEATRNWTVVPEGWAMLRAQWEYSHAANAVVLFIGFCAATFACLLGRH